MLLLEDCLKRIVAVVDSAYVATVCGSYRRGAASSGDIDVLLTHADFNATTAGAASKQPHLLKAVVDAAFQSGFATDQISLGDTKFMGVCRLPESMVEVC